MSKNPVTIPGPKVTMPKLGPSARIIETPRRPRVWLPVLAGLTAIVLFFFGFGGWAAVAPLQSAVIAHGFVGVESARKTVQHLEGGIVREILVKDGDAVSAGQVLVRLDGTQAGANVDLLRKRRDVALAMQARLQAQRDLKPAIEFPTDLVARKTDPETAEVLRAQVDIFNTHRESLLGQTAILNQRIAQLNAEIRGIEGEIAAEDRQLALLGEQVGTEQQLVAKNLSPRAKLLELQRQQAEIEGQRSQNRAAVARANQSVAEAQLRIGDLRTDAVDQAVKQLGEVQATLLDIAERLRAAEDIKQRMEVRASTAGTVVNLKVHSTGGVIAPGEALLEIVPAMDRLVIEARVEPHDADVVHIGLPSQVRLTAYNQRHALPLEGRVTQMSADRLTDERTGQHYYEARVELTESARVGDQKIYPGMPAEVIIVTAAHTLADYLLEPLTGVLRRSLREKQ